MVQGGGLRGVYSLGALAALEKAGLTDSFDLVVGSSAGAINAAYFLAGQAQDAIQLYTDYLSNRNFVNFARIWKIVDIDYMVDVVLKRVLPLDVDALRKSPSVLQVVLTDAETALPKVITNRDEEYDFYEVIRATSALPSLYNKKVRVGLAAYIDGGFAEALPLPRALEIDPELVVAVVTRLPGYRRSEHGVGYRLIARMLARGQSDAVKGLLGKPDSAFNTAMQNLEDGQADGSRVIAVFPSDASKLISRTTSDRDKLLACAEMGRQDMSQALASPL
jgi:predicted patatin/cPLA2 family phospholipase